MKRFMLEGTSLRCGEVKYTNTIETKSLPEALALTREQYEEDNGTAAADQISFSGFEQPEFKSKY